MVAALVQLRVEGFRACAGARAAGLILFELIPKVQ